MLPPPPGADNFGVDPAAELRLENRQGAAMLGSHAADIVEDFLESSEDWPEVEAEPELDLPPLPPPRPPAAA